MSGRFKKSVAFLLTIVFISITTFLPAAAAQKQLQDKESEVVVKADSISTKKIEEVKGKTNTQQVSAQKNKTKSKAYMNIILYLIYKMSGKMIN